MSHSYRNLSAVPFVLAAAVAVTAMSSRPARADFEFFTNQGAYSSRLSSLNYNQDKENVLFNKGTGGTSTTVQGRTNQTSTLINFTGNETIEASGGQDGITPIDGAYTQMFITPNDPLLSFRALELNPDDVRTAGGDITLRVFGAGAGASQTFVNGQNFIGIIATGSDAFRTAEVFSSNQNAIEEINQVRVVFGKGSPTTVVPEPGTYALMASGILPFAGAVIRRRKLQRN